MIQGYSKVPALLIFFLLLFAGSSFGQAPTQSEQDGDWTAGSTWNGGNTPNCNINQNVVIEHTVVCNCDPLEIQGNGSITIEDGGKLIVTSNTGLTGNGDLVVEDGGELEVQGDLDIGGNGSFVNDGNTSVEGSLDVSGNGDAGGSGEMYIGEEGCDDWDGPGGCTEGAVLPVELLAFDGAYQDGSVELDWSTGSEDQNDHFKVERAGSNASFETVGSVEGAGTTQRTQEYRFIDNDIDVVGTVYYRLVQVDRNGEREIHGPIAVKVEAGKNEDLKVHPNPIQDRAIVKSSHVKGSTAIVSVRDLTGRVLFQKEVRMSADRIELDRRAFASREGAYLLTVEDPISGERKTERVLVKGSF